MNRDETAAGRMGKGMKRIKIGKTGLEACRLGFGGIPIQRVSEAQAVETVLHALELGMDFVDTARGYTTSERRIGLALGRTRKKGLPNLDSYSTKV